jgi:hypothetical protein
MDAAALILAGVVLILLTAWWVGDWNDEETRSFRRHEMERRLRMWAGEDPAVVYDAADDELAVSHRPYDRELEEDPW